MTCGRAIYGEFALSRKETYGKNKKTNSKPVFTSRMEKHEYDKCVHFFDIRNVIDMTGFLKDIKENWNTYVSQVNRLIQENPIKKLILTGIFTIVLGLSAIHTSAAIVPEYTYQVTADEKVDTIAQAHGVTVHEIYAANGISSLDSGQKLLLPKVEDMSVTADTLNIRSQPTVQGDVVGNLKKGNTVKVSFIENGWAAIMVEGRIRYVSADYLSKNADEIQIAATSPSMYTVKAGDTFFKISKAFGMSVSSITELNPGVEPSKLKVGQTIRISNTAVSAPAKNESISTISKSVYVIKPGDTFSKISNDLGVSVSSIQGMNPGVDPSKLKVGQSIQIPNAAVSTPAQKESISTTSHSAYVIKPGDTFSKISKSLGVSTAFIQELNPGVDPSKLKVGQSIKITGSAAKTQTNNVADNMNNTTQYVVNSGDTLYKISKNLGVSVSSIQEMNPAVNPAMLKVGQSINIPIVTAAEVNHIKVEAQIIDADARGTFLFSTENGSLNKATASGVLLNELIEHKGEKLILTLKAKRGQEMTLAAIH